MGTSFMPFLYSKTCPLIFVIVSFLSFINVSTAVEPHKIITFGFTTSICLNKLPSQAIFSFGKGFLFSGGLHLTVFAMYRSFFLSIPAFSNNSFKNLPARPTKGSPNLSSSAPGASPISIILAFSEPSEKTSLFLPKCNGHFVQFSSSFFNSLSINTFYIPFQTQKVNLRIDHHGFLKLLPLKVVQPTI